MTLWVYMLKYFWVKNMLKRFNVHYIYVLLAAALWGCAGIFVRNLEGNAAQMEIVFGRAVFTAITLFFIILFKCKSLFKIKPKDIWIFAFSGIFSIVLFNFSYYTTMSLTSLSVAAVLLYTAPFFVVFMSLLFFGKGISLKTALACTTAFLGCTLVSGLFEESHRISPKALFFGLLTGFGYALYTVFGDMLIRRGYKTLTITFYVFLFAAIGTLPFISFSHAVISFSGKALPWIVLMAVFNTVLPYIFYTKGLFGVEPTVAPIIATLEPVVATLVGTFIFKESITLLGTLGVLLVLLSVGLLNFKSQNTVKLKVNAKINLSLYISGKRDDGYHEIDTVMQSVSLFDRLTVKKADNISLKCSKGHLSGEDNLGYKAAALFFKETKIKGGANIYIKKNIPEAAGLGGGSADAAAVLCALNRLYNTNLEPETLEKMSSRLGADVPFFIRGGTMRASGIGEILEGLKPFKSGFFVLAKGGTKPSTGEMYRRLDNAPQKEIDIDSSVKFAEENNLFALCPYLQNSFNEVWEDKSFENRLKEFSPLGVGLSGSGPTYFALFDNLKSAKKCEKALKKENVTAFTVIPRENSIIFE